MEQMRDFRIPSRHKRYSKKKMSRLVLMALLFGGIVMWFVYNWDQFADLDSFEIPQAEIYLPDAKDGIVYHKPGFSLSYVEKYELPEWVVYTLDVHMMNRTKNKRTQDFDPDPAIASGSGHYWDYKKSGYRRGHLVPSADMASDIAAMNATFLLSNVAPMTQTFNDGIWLELEHNVRDWSREYKSIQVVTGPIFKDPVTTIGDNEILVPRYFYKAIFTTFDDTPNVIGFIFDQTSTNFGPLDNYVVSIDSIEKVTGIELFSNLYGNWDTEISLEKRTGKPSDAWMFNTRWSDARQQADQRNENQ